MSKKLINNLDYNIEGGVPRRRRGEVVLILTFRCCRYIILHAYISYIKIKVLGLLWKLQTRLTGCLCFNQN